MYKVWKVLRAMCARQLPADIVRDLEREAEILRRNANMQHPVKKRAADAVTLRALNDLMRRAEYTKLTFGETSALEILAVAFMTMSRVAEVAALEVADVSRDGGEISVRPKTLARSWRRIVKRVTDLGHIRAATILRRRRETAIRSCSPLLFPSRKEGKQPLSSSAVSQRLRKVLRKLGSTLRVTAHSGRKGAALEALLSGVPIVAIQSFGAWKDLRTLELYVGEAVRRNVSLGDVLAERQRHGREPHASVWPQF